MSNIKNLKNEIDELKKMLHEKERLLLQSNIVKDIKNTIVKKRKPKKLTLLQMSNLINKYVIASDKAIIKEGKTKDKFNKIQRKFKQIETQIKKDKRNKEIKEHRNNIYGFDPFLTDDELVKKYLQKPFKQYLYKEQLAHVMYKLRIKIPLNEINLNTLQILINYIQQREINETNVKNHKGGYTIATKVIMSGVQVTKNDETITKYASFVINSTKESEIKYKLLKNSNKYYDTEGYILSVEKIENIIRKLDNKGGCTDNKCSSDRIRKCKYEEIIIRSYKSKNNNCLFASFNQHYNIKGNQLKPDIVRKALNIELNTKIDINMIPAISNYYNTKFKKNYGYMLVNSENQIIMEDDIIDNEYIKLYLMGEHYYLFEPLTWNNCKGCGKMLLKKNTEHICNIKHLSYKQRQINKDKSFITVQSIEEKNEMDYKKIMVFWDLETFQHEGEFNHKVYASGYYTGSDIINDKYYKMHYGKDAMNKTIDEFITYNNKNICAYNGSGFDFYFLIDELTNRGVKVSNLILSNGRLLSFCYGNNNKVSDLYLFIMSSLDDACKDFKIINGKSKFEHSLMKTWEDVEKYKNDVIPYLQKDVFALTELYITFNKMMYQTEKVNINNYITLSHMGYEIWASKLKDYIEIPNDKKKYEIIRETIYGGRTLPMQKEFKSEFYDDILNKEMTYNEKDKCYNLKSTSDENLYKNIINSGNYIFNADASSLYPASMSGFELMENIVYPVGKSRFSIDQKEEFENNKMGFYHISFTCPKDIRIAVLPRKKIDHLGHKIGVEWSLLDGSGYYSSVDIQNALDNNYNVVFTKDKECLIWDETAKPFKDYITKFYKIKCDAEKESNDVKKSIAKLLMNSLYGKMLQNAIFTTSTIANDIFEFNKFNDDHVLTDFVILNENKLLLTGEKKDYEKCIKKPSQLGSFITAYSRKIMLFYMKAIDPTLKTTVFTYTDTDSLHITGDAHKKLQALGYITTKKDARLGLLCSDIKKEGIILREKNNAPKNYIYEYINENNQLHITNCSTYKCKGIPKKYMNNEQFYNEEPTPINFDGLKKKGKTLSKQDVNNGLKHFSICNVSNTRTYNKSEWKGMTLKDNQFYPLGYEFKNIV